MASEVRNSEIQNDYNTIEELQLELVKSINTAFKNTLDNAYVGQEKLTELHKKLKKLEEEKKKGLEAIDKSENFLKELDVEEEKLKQQKANLLKERREREKEIERMRNEFNKEKENTIEINDQDMIKRLQRYEKALGLKYVRYKDNTLLFMFKNIDQNNADMSFGFHLKLENNLYSVTKCIPYNIEDLPHLVKELNETGKLMNFFTAMRRRFQMLCKSEC